MILTVVFFILGLLVGSFVNAAVWRLHSGERLINDRSRCPRCAHQLAVIDLIPIVSWILLGGRCRYCGARISIQYPIVEVLTGVVFALSAGVWPLETTVDYAMFSFWLVLVTGFLILAVYDLKWMLLPDKVLLPLLLPAIGLVATRALAADAAGGVIINHLGAALLAGLFFYSLYGYSRGRWMGAGDVKLVALLGLTLGLADTLIALLLAFNTAAIVSLALIGLKRLTRKDLLPFGPFLIGGAIVAMLYGQQLFEAYLRTFLLT